MKFNRAVLLFFLAATTVLLAAGNGYKLFQQGLAKERAEADLRGNSPEHTGRTCGKTE